MKKPLGNLYKLHYSAAKFYFLTIFIIFHVFRQSKWGFWSNIGAVGLI
jgi:hypothetical protein